MPRAGEAFREQLRTALAPFEMVREVRGLGYFSGMFWPAEVARSSPEF